MSWVCSEAQSQSQAAFAAVNTSLACCWSMIAWIILLLSENFGVCFLSMCWRVAFQELNVIFN